MKILFYRYGNICEPDILSVFSAAGLDVVTEDTEITEKRIAPEKRVRLLSDLLFKDSFSFVFSINFFPYISEICERFRILYVCFSTDCPVLELFSVSLKNSCNRIFLFDYAQYLRFHDRNPEHIYYLPLASNVGRWDSVLSGLTDADRKSFSSDVSFVGSLYTEKSPLASHPLPARIQGYLDGVVEAQLKVYGYNFLEEVVTPDLIETLKSEFPDYPGIPDACEDTDAYTAANYYLGMRAAELERFRTLETLSKKHSVTLYTHSLPPSKEWCGKGKNPEAFPLPLVTVPGGAATLTQMPKVFYLSKINLNITIKPIQTGLSLRVWDVLGCGGFLLTNYQAELSEYFEIGRDLDCYESMSDLEDKVDYYLSHEDIRREIAHNGYEKVKAEHTWAHRIARMLRILYPD